MGADFYFNRTCPHCGAVNSLHMGKSSYGWVFNLKIHPELDINDLQDWIAHARFHTGGIIVSQYGEELSPEAFEAVVLNRKELENLPILETDTCEVVPGKYLMRNKNPDRKYEYDISTSG